ncbi:MAG: class I SAM-dependent methyltransferase [Rikenellaceae bacterium]|jgi:SAM-dependent methyltransferase|nr:class I SAM-dependent methyltransferase [Rikenellaceae bacterium]
MQRRHSDPEQYFREQASTTARHVLPFVERVRPLTGEMTVAEIGCGGGGNMLPLLEAGCTVYGIDVNSRAISLAEQSFAGHPARERLTLIASDIYDVDPTSLPPFDLIIMRDVLEHIHDQERFIGHLYRFVKPGGGVFIAFPPFMMPFAGHQQMCEGPAGRLPYLHLLPRKLYALTLRMFGETRGRIEGLLEIKDTRLHLWRFHRIVRRSPFRVAREELWLVNPNYEVKFGLRPRRLPKALNIPWMREFFVTTCYVFLTRQ